MDPNAEQDPEKYPGFTGEAFPEAFTTMPPQPQEKKPGQLPPEKLKEYFEQGFTVVEGFFTPEELEPCIQSFNELVEEIAQKLYKTGRIKNIYEDHGFKDRLHMLDQEWPGAVILLLKLGKLTPAFQKLYANEKLLNAIEQMVGPDIAAGTVWNTRPKAPRHEHTLVPWHQDSCYFDWDTYKLLIATAWVAFVDSTPENGCMEFCRGVNQQGVIGVHRCCDNFYLMLDEEEMVKRFGTDPEKDFVLAPVKAGGIVFFNNCVPHRSIPNKSDHIRWAMDLRFQAADTPWGFYGMKQGILLRSPSKPDHVPDWDFYNHQDRYDLIKDYDAKRTGQKKADVFDTTLTDPYMEKHQLVVKPRPGAVGQKKADEFDTTLTGPHMEKYQIVAHNRHLAQFFADKKADEEAKLAVQK